MKQILKHSFEAVSLLTTNNGMLDVTIIPALNQPDWIIPSSLILSVDDYHEYTSTYQWQQQDITVFHLLPQEHTPDKIIVLEGNTTEYRFALQTAGELHQLQARISDVKDTELPDEFVQTEVTNETEQACEGTVRSYLYQAVMMDERVYLVPDLDKIAHHLVNVDN